MSEYLFGRDANPVGPELDTDPHRSGILACAEVFAYNAGRLKQLAARVEELGRSGADTVITLIDVDDPTGHGAVIADIFMPGHDWQQYRDRGEIPLARGLIKKASFPNILDNLGYHVAADELANTDELRIVVLHGQTVQVMDARFEQDQGYQ